MVIGPMYGMKLSAAASMPSSTGVGMSSSVIITPVTTPTPALIRAIARR